MKKRGRASLLALDSTSGIVPCHFGFLLLDQMGNISTSTSNFSVLGTVSIEGAILNFRSANSDRQESSNVTFGIAGRGSQMTINYNSSILQQIGTTVQITSQSIQGFQGTVDIRMLVEREGSVFSLIEDSLEVSNLRISGNATTSNLEQVTLTNNGRIRSANMIFGGTLLKANGISLTYDANSPPSLPLSLEFSGSVGIDPISVTSKDVTNHRLSRLTLRGLDTEMPAPPEIRSMVPLDGNRYRISLQILTRVPVMSGLNGNLDTTGTVALSLTQLQPGLKRITVPTNGVRLDSAGTLGYQVSTIGGWNTTSVRITDSSQLRVRGLKPLA